MDCDKHKKRALVGLIILTLLPISNIFDLKEYNLDGLFIFIAFVCTVLALYLMLPYARCLGDFNNRNKTPFS